MKNVKKVDILPSGNYRVRVSYIDEAEKRHFRSFTASTPSEAMKRAEEFERSMKQIAPDKHNPTVRQVIEQYIRQKEGVLSPTTIQSYKRYLTKSMPEIMDRRVSSLTVLDMQKAVDTECKRVSVKTVKNVYGLISASLKNHNRNLIFPVRMPSPGRTIYEIPSSEELRALFRIIEGTQFEIAVYLAVYLGLRASEVRGLQYGDIKDGKAFIHRSVVDVNGKPVIKERMKNTTSTRILNVPSVLEQKINQFRGEKTEKDFIVTYKGVSLTNAMIRYCKKAGIRKLRFHDLRHVFASVMLRLNIPDKYAMQLGGWATTSTMKTVYQHTMADYTEEINRQIADYIDNFIHQS